MWRGLLAVYACAYSILQVQAAEWVETTEEVIGAFTSPISPLSFNPEDLVLIFSSKWQYKNSTGQYKSNITSEMLSATSASGQWVGLTFGYIAFFDDFPPQIILVDSGSNDILDIDYDDNSTLVAAVSRGGLFTLTSTSPVSVLNAHRHLPASQVTLFALTPYVLIFDNDDLSFIDIPTGTNLRSLPSPYPYLKISSLPGTPTPTAGLLSLTANWTILALSLDTSYLLLHRGIVGPGNNWRDWKSIPATGWVVWAGDGVVAVGKADLDTGTLVIPQVRSLGRVVVLGGDTALLGATDPAYSLLHPLCPTTGCSPSTISLPSCSLPTVSILSVEGICLDRCPSGQTLLSTGCILCPRSCQSCTPTQCISCIPPLTLSTGGECALACPPHQYPGEGRECLHCHSSCSECDGPRPTQCRECRDGWMLRYRQCTDDCGPGMYAVKNRCAFCQPGCVKCDPLGCMECDSGLYWREGVCSPDCPLGEGMRVVGGKCLHCPQGCKQCQENGCTSCEEGYELIWGGCEKPDKTFRIMISAGVGTLAVLAGIGIGLYFLFKYFKSRRKSDTTSNQTNSTTFHSYENLTLLAITKQ